jgi:hypothetical protein
MNYCSCYTYLECISIKSRTIQYLEQSYGTILRRKIIHYASGLFTIQYIVEKGLMLEFSYKVKNSNDEFNLDTMGYKEALKSEDEKISISKEIDDWR